MDDAMLLTPEMLKRLGAYARSQGLTTEEIRGKRDPRMLKMVYKAMLYDEGQATPKAEPVSQAKPTPSLNKADAQLNWKATSAVLAELAMLNKRLNKIEGK